jgi:predicted DNA-binding protein
MSARRVSLRISSALSKQLADFVKQTGRTESDVVREALEAYCLKHASNPSAYDRLQELGWIGDAKNLPTDLSTNPIHMEGFGRD